MRLIFFSITLFLLLVSCSGTKVYTESGITNLTQLTTDRTFEVDTCVSSDGKMIAFASDRGGNLELWMVPTGGGGIQQITVSSNSLDRAPDLSINSDEIVFQSTRVTGVWSIWKISLGNGGLTQLTNNQNGSLVPKWSPDGKKIVYSRETTEGNFDIWFMNSNGTNPFQITRESEKQELYPVWSSDSKNIAYVVQYDKGDFYNIEKGRTLSDIDEFRSEIWMMDEYGKNQTQLTAFKGLNISPSWYPEGKIDLTPIL